MSGRKRRLTSAQIRAEHAARRAEATGRAAQGFVNKQAPGVRRDYKQASQAAERAGRQADAQFDEANQMFENAIGGDVTQEEADTAINEILGGSSRDPRNLPSPPTGTPGARPSQQAAAPTAASPRVQRGSPPTPDGDYPEGEDPALVQELEEYLNSPMSDRDKELASSPSQEEGELTAEQMLAEAERNTPPGNDDIENSRQLFENARQEAQRLENEGQKQGKTALQEGKEELDIAHQEAKEADIDLSQYTPDRQQPTIDNSPPPSQGFLSRVENFFANIGSTIAGWARSAGSTIAGMFGGNRQTEQPPQQVTTPATNRNQQRQAQREKRKQQREQQRIEKREARRARREGREAEREENRRNRQAQRESRRQQSPREVIIGSNLRRIALLDQQIQENVEQMKQEMKRDGKSQEDMKQTERWKWTAKLITNRKKIQEQNEALAQQTRGTRHTARRQTKGSKLARGDSPIPVISQQQPSPPSTPPVPGKNGKGRGEGRGRG